MSHTFTHLAAHVVFGTKDRSPLIGVKIKQRLFSYMGGIVRELGGRALIINGMPDHAHLLLCLPATVAIADAVRTIKANSSRWVHETWPERKGFSWQQGYGAFSVSRSAISDVEAYIANQEEHHRKITFEEEFVALLKRHDIQFEATFLWK
jgi:putative transposase